MEREIDFDKMGGLVPAIIQDADTRNVLMLGFMNREAYQKTLDTGLVTFWSRTRQCLWTKGETSGNYLHLVSLKADCDRDTLLVRVHPDGPVCHLGTDTCWAEDNKPTPTDFLAELQRFIAKRKADMPENSYTTALFRKGTKRIAQKVGEEALETALEAVDGDSEHLIYESADLVYHLMVLLADRGLSINQVAEELAKRHDPNWDKARRESKAKGTYKK